MKEQVVRGFVGFSSAVLLAGLMSGCRHEAPAAKGPAMQGMPVQTATVNMAPVPLSNEYVATIKSRRSATMQPQVSGQLTAIRVVSGEHVRAGQVMMQIDSHLQQATVESLRATERQKKALFDYNTIEQERQHKLFEAGVTSRDTYDQEKQAYENARADYEAAVSSRRSQEENLAYYTIRAPFDGIVGDVPVHVGDYVSPSTTLTTVDINSDLEAYIYIPTERSTQVHPGLDVDLTDNDGKLLEKTRINFVSPQVDSTVQGILVKAPVHATPEMLRTAQLIKARVVWTTEPMAVIPVLAVIRQGGQSFVYVAQEKNGMTVAVQTPVTLGDTVNNTYAVKAGLKSGDKVIVSSTQFLVNGMPVMLLNH